MLTDYEMSPGGILVPARRGPPIGVDLFAGCGGFSLGMESGGIDVAAAVEWTADAACTYALNLGAAGGRFVFGSPEIEAAFRKRARRINSPVDDPRWFGSNRQSGWGVAGPGARAVIVADVRDLSGADILEAAGLHRTDVKVVFGGPPCQGFSRSGRQDPADPRNNLVLEFLRLVDELQPDIWVMENVPPLIQQPSYQALWQEMQRRANGCGYDVMATIMDAVNYGVAQFRRRAFIFGHRPGTRLSLPMPSHWLHHSPVGGDVRHADAPDADDDDYCPVGALVGGVTSATAQGDLFEGVTPC